MIDAMMILKILILIQIANRLILIVIVIGILTISLYDYTLLSLLSSIMNHDC